MRSISTFTRPMVFKYFLTPAPSPRQGYALGPGYQIGYSASRAPVVGYILDGNTLARWGEGYGLPTKRLKQAAAELPQDRERPGRPFWLLIRGAIGCILLVNYAFPPHFTGPLVSPMTPLGAQL